MRYYHYFFSLQYLREGDKFNRLSIS